MSFGGATERYTLEYLIKVTNQGGAAAGSSGLNQVNNSVKQLDTGTRQATASMDQLVHAKNKVTQAGLAQTKAVKGLAFGMIGMVTAGAEMVGMLSMWSQVQTAQSEAQAEANRALKEGGKESKEYKQAMKEVADANRWASMTFRNLMLSTFDMVPFIVLTINGFMKSRTALKALREAQVELKLTQDALSKSNVGIAATNKVVDASYVSSAKGATNLATAKKGLAAANLSHNGSLITTIPLLGKTAKGLDTATVAATRTTKAMRVLSIAAKVLIPLIALEVGAQAYERNWGGFADKVNLFGKAIGDTIPQLRGMLGWVDKIGRSVVAIFTGNFERIGSIWNPVTEGAEEVSKISDEAQKKIDETREKLLDFRHEAIDFVTELSRMDKGEQKDALKFMGIKGDARKELRGFLNTFEDVQDTVEGFHDGIKQMEAINMMQKLGMDVDFDKVFDKFAYTMEDRFNELGKDFEVEGPAKDLFEQFADVLGDAAREDSGEKGLQNIMAFLDNNPDFMAYLIEHEPDLALSLQTMLENASLDAAEAAKGAVGKNLANAFTTGDILNPDSGETKDEYFGTKKIGGDLGPLQPIADEITKGVKALTTHIQGIDWVAVGAALREGVNKIFTLSNAMALGTFIRVNLVGPIVTAIGEAFRPVMEEFKKNPLGLIGAVVDKGTAWLGAFVAGLFGYNSEGEMFGDIMGKINTIFSNNENIMALKQLVNHPIATLVSILRGNFDPDGPSSAADEEVIAANSGTSGILALAGDILEKLGISGFIHEAAKAYDMAVKIFDAIKGSLGFLLTDPLGWIMSVFSLLSTPGTLQNDLLTSTKEIVMSKLGFTNFFDSIDSAYGVALGVINFWKGGLLKLITDPWGWLQDQAGQNTGIDPVTGQKITPTVPGYIPGGTPTFEDLNQSGGDRDERGLGWEYDAWVQHNTNPKNKYGNQAFGTRDPHSGMYIIRPNTLGYMPVGMGGSGGSGFVPGSAFDTAQKKAQGEQVTQKDPMLTAAETTAQAIQNVYLAMSVHVIKTFDLMATGAIKTMMPIITAASTTVTSIGQVFSMMSITIQQIWSQMTLNIASMWGTLGIEMTAFFGTTILEIDSMTDALAVGMYTVLNQSLQNIAGVMNMLGSHWSMHMNKAGANAESGGDQIVDALEGAMDDVKSAMSDMASHWSKMCNSLGANARSAAKQINKALDSIEDEEVVIHYRTTGSRFAKGGLMSMADGGIMSAASGRLLTTSGPRLFQIGDNPGGRESVWAIPHDNPGPTVAKIDRMYKPGKGGSGGRSEIVLNAMFNLSGNDIINQYKLGKKIKMVVGNDMDKYGA